MIGPGKGHKPEQVGLPLRAFLYTTDQVAGLLSLSVAQGKAMFFYEGRTTRVYNLSMLRFLNIANDDEKPMWRCSEAELIRWMRKKKFFIYETYRASATRRD